MDIRFTDLTPSQQRQRINSALRRTDMSRARATRELADQLSDELGLIEPADRAQLGRTLAGMAKGHTWARPSGETFNARGRTFNRYVWSRIDTRPGAIYAEPGERPVIPAEPIVHLARRISHEHVSGVWCGISPAPMALDVDDVTCEECLRAATKVLTTQFAPATDADKATSGLEDLL